MSARSTAKFTRRLSGRSRGVFAAGPLTVANDYRSEVIRCERTFAGLRADGPNAVSTRSPKYQSLDSEPRFRRPNHPKTAIRVAAGLHPSR
jgi:hypothetical protein